MDYNVKVIYLSMLGGVLPKYLPVEDYIFYEQVDPRNPLEISKWMLDRLKDEYDGPAC